MGRKWQKPRVKVASAYIDQFPEGDLAHQRVEKHRLKMVGTIEDALTLGTKELAVDGVVIIAEHGNYPTNEKGAETLSTIRLVQAGRARVRENRQVCSRLQRQTSVD